MGTEEEAVGEVGRKSKDGKMNRKVRLLVECSEKRGWSILNGGDEGGRANLYRRKGRHCN